MADETIDPTDVETDTVSGVAPAVSVSRCVAADRKPVSGTPPAVIETEIEGWASAD